LEMILSVASIVCLIAACLTSFTFIVDIERFRYPEQVLTMESADIWCQCSLMLS
jgi:hypothetical protein